MSTVSSIDGSQLKDMFIAGSKWLKVHMAHINALNVFPVPDGDTGTNMFLTLQAALKNIQPYAGSHAGDLAALASQGALMGARGNSGVILSQILDGFSEGLAGKAAFSTPDFAVALQKASNKAYKAVIDPVEGTILTVIKETARTGQQIAKKRPRAGDFLSEVVETAQLTLSLTPELLPVLKEAGVVDSGGQGLVYFLEGMLRAIKNLPIEVEMGEDTSPVETSPASLVENEAGYGYDVQFLIKGEKLNIEAVRETIVSMGECPLVVGNENTIKVHVHVPDPGVPISYGITQGYLTDVVVENMDAQSQEFFGQKESMIVSEPTSDIATICVAPGDGFAEVFKGLGAHGIISGGQTMNPSTQEFLTAINHLLAPKIIILPNNSNIILTAQQASSMAEKEVVVLPTKTVPQGISALMAFHEDAALETNLQQMTATLSTVYTIEVTRAVRATTVNGITVQEGDVIGLLDGNLVATGEGIGQVSLAVLNQIDVGDLEIVTLYYGQDITPDAADTLSNLITGSHPHLEVEVVDGGQPYYQYIISLE